MLTSIHPVHYGYCYMSIIDRENNYYNSSSHYTHFNQHIQRAQPESSTPKEQTEEPIWVRRERERELMEKEGGGDLPFGVYLLASAIVAIAAVGSIFEYANKNPIFDVIGTDSPLYTPILGFFALTGLPVSGFLFYKAVSSANKEAERMDKLDGY